MCSIRWSFFLLVPGVLPHAPLLAQTPPAILWQRALGGTGYDAGSAVLRTSDGAFVMAGRTASTTGDVTVNHGEDDVWVGKLTASGELLWQVCLGGSSDDEAFAITETNDGDLVLAGRTLSINFDVTGNEGIWDAWVVRLTDTGELMWQHTFGGHAYDEAYAIEQTIEGGFIVAGWSDTSDNDAPGNHGGYGDAWLLKIDAQGNLEWQHEFGGTDTDKAYAVIQTSDQGFLFGGKTASHNGDVSGHHGGGDDGWVVKLNSSGTLEWQRTLGGSNTEVITGLCEAADGGFVVVGNTHSTDGDVSGNHGGLWDAWMVKLNETGNVEWQRALGGSADDGAAAVTEAPEGQFVLAGYTYSFDGDVTGNHGYCDAWLVAVDADGTVQWKKTLGGENTDVATCIRPSADGYIVSGTTSSTSGDVTGNHGQSDAWVVHLGPAGVGVVEHAPAAFVVRPTGDRGMFRITRPGEGAAAVAVHDLLGRAILHTPINGPSAELDLRQAGSGVYLVTLGTGASTYTARVVLE